VNTLTDEFRIDEQTMNEAIDLVKEGGDLEHRMLYHILTSFRDMGYRWRGDNELEAEFEDDYANYLDLKAQKENITWEEYKERLS
jgi:hypothetical protein